MINQYMDMLVECLEKKNQILDNLTILNKKQTELSAESEQKKRGVKTPQKIYASFCEMKRFVLNKQSRLLGTYKSHPVVWR